MARTTTTLLLALLALCVAALPAHACVCTRDYRPVCGDDGKTYGNACTAACAKVKVVYSGECVDVADKCPESARNIRCIAAPCTTANTPCKGRDDVVCLNSYCGASIKVQGYNVPSGCQAVYVSKTTGAVVPGCLPEPVCKCTKEAKPVCGTDKRTYANKCMAECASVSVAYTGECFSADCRLVRCSYNRDKVVCGKDGVTYNNLCQAKCVGNVDVAYQGKCSPAACSCPAIFMPVCGRDGKTWSNSCEAGCNGVKVAYPGKCGPPKDLTVPCLGGPSAKCPDSVCKRANSCKRSAKHVCIVNGCVKPVTYQGVKLTKACSPVYVSKATGVIDTKCK